MTNTDPHFLSWKDNTDGTACTHDDKYLQPFADVLHYRYSKFKEVLVSIESA